MFTMRAGFIAVLVLAVGAVAGCGRDQMQSNSSSAKGVADQPKAGQELRISGPYTHENLAVYLIHGKDRMPGKVYTTLEEAMAQRKVIVHETGDVNELAIQNVSADEVYVQSGDIVKGGRQDRTIANDFVLVPKSDKVPIAAFCVEAGRWQQRGDEGSALFSVSESALPSKGLKLAVKQQQQQQAVWQNVEQSQQRLTMNAGQQVQSATSPSSLQLTLENKAVQETTEAYVRQLQPAIEGKADVIGYAFAVNGKMNSADVYASHAFFTKLWPRLIRASAVEAFAELEKGRKFDAPAMQEVQACIEEPKGQAKRQRINDRTETATYDAKDSIFFDTYDATGGGQPIHRNYINKEGVEAPSELQESNVASPSQQEQSQQNRR